MSMKSCVWFRGAGALATLLTFLVALLLQPGVQAEPIAYVVRNESSPQDARLADELAARLADTGYLVQPLDLDALCEAENLPPGGMDLLVLPNGGELPVRAMPVIDRFAKGGGDILALNAPLWQRALIRAGGQWTNRDSYCREHAADPPPHVLFDFSGDALAEWTRTTDRAANPVRHEIVDGPGQGQKALHVEFPQLTGWETYASPTLDGPFPPGHTLTVFAAKGGPNTTQLAVEWMERDGSRWIATVHMTTEWQLFVLEPKDFRFWESVPARRNGVFNPANAEKLSVGLAFTHTRIGGDEHAYWVGPIGTAERTADYDELLAAPKPPIMDTLCPTYKYFASTDVGRLYSPDHMRWFLETRDTAVPLTVRSPHPRPKGNGFDKGREWRWAPLVECETAGGEWRGNPATLLVHAEGPYKGGVWLAYGIGDAGWYLSEPALAWVMDAVRRMRQWPYYLVDGGAECYTYTEGQTVTLGARVAHVGEAPVSTGLTARVQVEDAAGQKLFVRDLAVDVEPGGVAAVSCDWPRGEWPASGECTVRAMLIHGSDCIDHVEHTIHLWKPKENPSYITAEGGEFVLDGERWRAHGVNYMPSSGIGIEDWEYFEYWVGKRSYDPDIIQRDLEHCKDMGLNALSVFQHFPSNDSRNLLDLLRRADEMDLKVNLSLRPGTPLDFEWEKISTMLRDYQVAEHDCVFALDLAWEPMWRDHDARKRWDPAWEAWVIERYGSIEEAERVWGFEVPRDGTGAVTNPVIPQLDEDGPWRVMVAAYRRFLDTLLYEYYSRARTLVRGIDPHHLVSFRMTEAGNPTCKWRGHLPYDYPYLAAAVDLFEPEAYGRIGDWERVKPGWFQVEYARWANPELPCMWAEAGVSAWVQGQAHATTGALAFQGQYFSDFYRMLIGSASDGIFWWWYPGGYRVNERSDYGIINPDGSGRPATRTIREHADAFLNGPSMQPVDYWLEFDRGAHVTGIAGVYDELRDEFWRAIEQGRTPGLRTPGTGTTSADCPPLGVGNVPWDKGGPPKYLDGWFDKVEVRTADGEWSEVRDGAAVHVGSQPPVARVSVTNLAEAAWLAETPADEPGAVRIVSAGKGEAYAALPYDVERHDSAVVQGVPLLADGGSVPQGEETRVTLTFEAQGRVRFGPRFAVKLMP